MVRVMFFAISLEKETVETVETVCILTRMRKHQKGSESRSPAREGACVYTRG